MVRKIKFGLNMPNKKNVGCIEDLQKYFDLECILQYYFNGKLIKWLEDRNYISYVNKMKEINDNSENLKKSLCSIFGVEYVEKNIDINVDDIENFVEKRNLLRRYTDSKEILENINLVAFSLEELNSILEKIGNEEKKIYLLGNSFKISLKYNNKTYVGINNPEINMLPVGEHILKNKNIKLENVHYKSKNR